MGTKNPFAGVLRKPIDLGEAPARGLRAAFALPPDESDQLAYAQTQLGARWKALDEFFGLKSNAPNIWEQRASMLIERKFAINSDASQWWGRLAIRIADGYVPGISFKQANKKKHGAPLEWTDVRLAELFADVEYMKKTTQLSDRGICELLSRKRQYRERWGKFKAATLRRAYLDAKKRSKGVLFKLVLCGPAATIPSNRIDPIEAAIERHAIKPK
jgi:hypothetical protein